MKGAVVGALVAGLGVAVSGCSSSATDQTIGASQAAQKTAGAGTTGAETPAFASNLDRVCADGLGFPGLPAYKRSAKAVHPAVLMSKNQKSWTQNTPLAGDFPSGWILGYADNVKKTQLVVCFERTGASPAGKTCKMEDDKTHKPLLVTMFNTTYRLRVLEARTGKALYEHDGRAASTTCPLLTFINQDDDPTKYYTEARPADYRGVLKRFIAA
jgi:hypothetical protein